jgi:Predicted periplasmic or secreted lipoprotein
LLATSAAPYTANARTETAREYVADSTITAAIKAGIYGDPAIKILQITVETYKGVVQLSGFVDNKTQAQRAEEIALSVKGVREVRNNLIVKSDV